MRWLALVAQEAAPASATRASHVRVRGADQSRSLCLAAVASLAAKERAYTVEYAVRSELMRRIRRGSRYVEIANLSISKQRRTPMRPDLFSLSLSLRRTSSQPHTERSNQRQSNTSARVQILASRMLMSSRWSPSVFRFREREREEITGHC